MNLQPILYLFVLKIEFIRMENIYTIHRYIYIYIRYTHTYLHNSYFQVKKNPDWYVKA